MPYSAGRMLASKIAYSARNSASRIYPSLAGRHNGGKKSCTEHYGRKKLEERSALF